MKKRIWSWILLTAMLVTALSGCSAGGSSDGKVTRGQWIRMLTLEFGMYTYDSEEPYYSDVDDESEYFAPVQIAGEWGILAGGKSFDPEKTATKGFIAETLADTMGLEGQAGTSVKAEGYDENKIGLLADKNVINVKNGKFDPEKTMDQAECEELLQKAYQVWCKKSFPNQYASVTVKEGVVDLREEDLTYTEETVIEESQAGTEEKKEAGETGAAEMTEGMQPDIQSQENGWNQENSQSGINGSSDVNSSLGGNETRKEVTKVTVPESTASNLTEGMVFILPADENNPEGTAYKVRSVEKTEGGNTVIYAETPNLEDLFEEIEIQGDYTPDYDNIKVEEGVTYTVESLDTSAVGLLDQNSVQPEYDTLVYRQYTDEFANTASKSLGDAVDFRWDNGKGMTYQFKVGDISLSSDIDISCIPMNVKKAYLRLDYKIINQLNYKTHSDNTLEKADGVTEEKKLASLEIPLQAGFKVAVDIVGRITVDGELEISLNCQGANGIEIINNKVRAIKQFSCKPKVMAEATLTLTGDLSLNLEHALLKKKDRLMRILGAGAELGPTVTVSADFVKNCFDLQGYVGGKIYVLSDFKLGSLELNWSQEFWTKSNTPYEIAAHMEDWRLVPKCTRTGEEQDTGSKTPETPDNNGMTGENPGGEGVNGGSGNSGNDGNGGSGSGTEGNGKDIVLSSYNVFLKTGETSKIQVSIEGARFESENSGIASVDGSGTVTAVSSGTTSVDIYDQNGRLAASIAVQVD